MRIAILKKDYSASGGGAERYARELCEGLAKRGHEVFVHSQTFNAPEQKGIFHIKVPKTHLRAFSPTVNFHKSIQKVLRRVDYDIVYALSRTFPSDFYRVTESLHCEWMKIRYPNYQRYNPRHSGILKLEKEIFSEEKTGTVICNSELTKNQVIANFAFPADKIKVLRNGVDHGEFRPANSEERLKIRKNLNLNDEQFVLLFAASDFRIKGFAHALKALSLLPEPLKKKTLLIVAGSGKITNYAKLAESLNIVGNIRFVGRIERMREYYVASDILLHPALYEPFANVCLEAMACGLPVLTTKTNGASELIEEGVNGFTVPSASDEAEMADKLAKFASCKSPRQRSESALNSVKYLSWDLHIDGFLALYSTQVKI